MENETTIRLGIFVTVLVAMIIIERFLPKRELTVSRTARWFTNFSISVINVISLNAMAFVLPVLAVGAAIDASANGLGVLNTIAIPFWVELLVTLLLLDLVIWAQHWATHKVPFLWRLHRVHHSDENLDVSSALRFHPIEIVLSMLLKIGVVYVLGADPWVVVAYEVLLNGMAMFNHANIRLPNAMEKALRLVVVTPDMHRIHHSIDRAEHDMNYGNALSIWDRVFGTYLPEPQDGQLGMKIGLTYPNAKPTRLDWSLLFPFFRK